MIIEGSDNPFQGVTTAGQKLQLLGEGPARRTVNGNTNNSGRRSIDVDEAMFGRVLKGGDAPSGHTAQFGFKRAADTPFLCPVGRRPGRPGIDVVIAGKKGTPPAISGTRSGARPCAACRSAAPTQHKAPPDCWGNIGSDRARNLRVIASKCELYVLGQLGAQSRAGRKAIGRKNVIPVENVLP